jgi:hypothetical protein
VIREEGEPVRAAVEQQRSSRVHAVATSMDKSGTSALNAGGRVTKEPASRVPVEIYDRTWAERGTIASPDVEPAVLELVRMLDRCKHQWYEWDERVGKGLLRGRKRRKRKCRLIFGIVEAELPVSDGGTGSQTAP